MLLNNKIAFIGFGNMARALAEGAINAGILSKANIIVSSPGLRNGTRTTGFSVAESNQQAAQFGNIIILGTKPDKIQDICKDISDTIKTRKNKPLLVSIAAGVSTATIETYLQCDQLPIARVMPNTPVEVGLGASGIYTNPYVTEDQLKVINAILESSGIAVHMDNEDDLDKITAISGSGPAYFLLFQELITASAEKLGLDRDVATRLVAQTMLGTSMLTRKTNLDFNESRQRVTSTGGTTAAAINRFISGGLEKIVDDAVNAAYQRAVELRRTFNSQNRLTYLTDNFPTK